MNTNTTITAIATGLSAPRGFAWGADGTLYVAQSGPGNTADAIGRAASVVKIVNGCPVAVATGLPSTQDPYADVLGPNDVQFTGAQLYILQTAHGESGENAHNPELPNGIYSANPDGTISLWFDHTAYITANPPRKMPSDPNPLGEPYRFFAVDHGFWLVDSNRSMVFFIDMNKHIERIADFSEEHPILTAATLDGQGGLYVGTLTTSPHKDGAAWVRRVDRDGTFETIWTNLNVLTGLARDSQNRLYALEMSTDNESEHPGPGRVVRRTGPDSAEVIASGFEFPIQLATGPDDALYVSMPAYGPNTQAGMILRIPTSASNTTVDLSSFAGIQCDDAPAYTPPGATS